MINRPVTCYLFPVPGEDPEKNQGQSFNIATILKGWEDLMDLPDAPLDQDFLVNAATRLVRVRRHDEYHHRGYVSHLSTFIVQHT